MTARQAPTGTDGSLIVDRLFEHRIAAERSTIIARYRWVTARRRAGPAA